MPIDTRSRGRKIFSFIVLIAIGVEGLIRGPEMMPDLIAYILSGLPILLSGVAIIAPLMTRTRKRWANVTRRV